MTNPTKKYQIRITFPAGSTELFCYSDEEISPKGNTLTFYAGEGLGDTEIKLLPIEVREENAYESTYITRGLPVEMDVEKGAWFKISVNIQNPTDESKDVYISPAPRYFETKKSSNICILVSKKCILVIRIFLLTKDYAITF
ncbi:MAG: hypothetical protein K2N87_00625 [Eubacterium sp.]|nr:hypothetical protein [Eubacterium sp.]